MGSCCVKQELTDEDIHFLKKHTRYDEETIREWYAGFLQDCPNGKLTPSTFCEMYKMFFPAGDADKFCENVFRTFDADKSGTIDFKEFLMAIDVTSAGTPREKLLWAFRCWSPSVALGGARNYLVALYQWNRNIEEENVVFPN
jgi:Ca2+-binding EF-hand superfamily protein